MRIVRLEAQNIKRLQAVSITPEGNLVVIGGKNAAGKSSVLDSIASALGGKSACPGKPVRAGETKAKVLCDLGDLVVTRTFTESGGGSLTVKSKDGATYPSPQAMLDGLVGKMTFDPLAFLREVPKRQVETLKGLVGLDFADSERERAELYQQRAVVNQDVKRLAARIADLPQPAAAPAEEVSVVALAGALREAHATNQRNTAIRQQSFEAMNEVTVTRNAIKDLQQRLKTLETNEAELRSQAGGLKDVDTASIEQQIAEAENANRRVRDNQERQEAADALAEQQEIAAGLSERIAAIDEAKVLAMQEASFPVDGLSFAEDGLIYNGIPLVQASSAEQLRVSVAVGLAMNPTLRVLLIRDGSLLDEDSLRLMAEMAAAADAQVWLERVGEGAECQVVIEDGMVRPEGTMP